MNKLKYILSTLLIGLGAVSCTDMLDDNVNPDKSHAITVDAGLPLLVFYAQQMTYDHSDYYIYLSQCLTTTAKTNYSYSYKSEWEFLQMNRHPQWRRHYFDIGKNVLNMIDYSKEANSPNYELIARTIRLFSMQMTTDMFGEMPLSNAYKSNSPTYDTQPQVYAWMFQEIEDLLAAYENPEMSENPASLKIDAKQDRVYAGDLEKWKGLVYAIKARLLLRNIPNIDTTPATCQAIIDAADAAINQWRKGDLLYGSWFGNEPRYKFDGGVQEQNCVWGPAKPIVNGWESRTNNLDTALPSKFFVVDCLGLINAENSQAGTYNAGGTYEGYSNDPRLTLLMIPRTGPEGDAASKVRYLENNIGAGTSYKVEHYPSLYQGAYAGANDCYNPIITMEELYFIKAEALYWKGDKATACALVKEATKYNVQRHLDYFLEAYPNPDYKVEDDNKYPGAAVGDGTMGWCSALQWEARLAAFFDNEKYSEFDRRGREKVMVRPVSERGNKRWYFDESQFDLEALMTQKYIAMYMQPEQFTDMRRYHFSNNRNNYGIGDNNEIVYPNLRRPYNLYAPYWIDGLTDEQKENLWVQRIPPDPDTEGKYNRKELERIGAYNNYKYLQKPLIWALERGERTSLTAE